RHRGGQRREEGEGQRAESGVEKEEEDQQQGYHGTQRGDAGHAEHHHVHHAPPPIPESLGGSRIPDQVPPLRETRQTRKRAIELTMMVMPKRSSAISMSAAR